MRFPRLAILEQDAGNAGAAAKYRRRQDEISRAAAHYRALLSATDPKARAAELPLRMADVILVKTLQEYFRSHPPASVRRGMVERLIAEQRWPRGPQRTLPAAYLLRHGRATRLLAVGQIEKAAKAAREALALNPRHLPALNLLGEITFTQAKFAEASDLYRRSLDLEPAQPDVVSRFAVSLAASVAPADATRRFSEWFRQIPAPDLTVATRVEDAGLKLAAGDSETAATLLRLLAGATENDTPFLRARLGWWYFHTGNPAIAPLSVALANEAFPRERLFAFMTQQAPQM